MPSKGSEKRGQQLAALSGTMHDLKTSPQLGSLLETLKDIS